MHIYSYLDKWLGFISTFWQFIEKFEKLLIYYDIYIYMSKLNFLAFFNW